MWESEKKEDVCAYSECKDIVSPVCWDTEEILLK
jgi:hypothetical protein